MIGSSARSISFTSTRSRSSRPSSGPSPRSTRSCAACPTTPIRQDQPRLHERLKQIVDALPQLRAIFLIDRDGRPIVSSQLAQVPADFNVGDRDFFEAQAAGHAGTYVSDVHTPRLTGFGTPFFVLSRRRPSADGSFNGVVAVAVLPRYFEDFYSLIGRSPGSFFALVQADGKFLARYPAATHPAARSRGRERCCNRRWPRPGSAWSTRSRNLRDRWGGVSGRLPQARGLSGRRRRGHRRVRRSAANGTRRWPAI